MLYHIGLVRGIDAGLPAYHTQQYRESVLFVEMRRCIDFLSCETWKYMGRRETTKRAVYEKRKGLLRYINMTCGTRFTRIIVD